MTRALILALLAALLGCAGTGWWAYSLRAELADERADRARETAERERQAHAYDNALAAGIGKATDAYITRARAADRAASGIDAAYRGVLDTINAAGGTADDPAAACRHDAERVAVLGRLLAEGAGLAAEGAERVGRLDAQVSGLQDHARAVAGAASQVPVNP